MVEFDKGQGQHPPVIHLILESQGHIQSQLSLIRMEFLNPDRTKVGRVGTVTSSSCSAKGWRHRWDAQSYNRLYTIFFHKIFSWDCSARPLYFIYVFVPLHYNKVMFSIVIGSIAWVAEGSQSQYRNSIPIGLNCDLKCTMWPGHYTKSTSGSPTASNFLQSSSLLSGFFQSVAHTAHSRNGNMLLTTCDLKSVLVHASNTANPWM